MNRNIEIPEILAPVGSIDAFYSAIHNGCDAIYLGGHNFGARAYANNFGQDELKNLVDYAHIFNVQVYYTLNTLVKDIEMKALGLELDLMRFVNIDAVIIQDLGVYHYIKENYSDLVIHGSTQMNLHSVKDAELAKSLGFDRVVLSRECSLEDIKKIKEATGIEIEAFVHGALCYCYSGQCLMSSMYGGRSGNRGKCAQPCRMVYEVEDEAGYFLSPKDQMTLTILPELIKAGVDSFKIEGRMKSAQYVGFATNIYKKYRDLSLTLIRSGQEDQYKVDPKDIQELNQLFNRGHFTDGYYKKHNAKEMISYTHGKNQGWPVGTMSIVNNMFAFDFQSHISKDDLLEIHTDLNLKNQETWPAFSFNEDVKKGSSKQSNIYDDKRQKLMPKKFLPNKKYQVYRIRDKGLLDKLKVLAETKTQFPLKLIINAYVNQPLQIQVFIKGNEDFSLSLVGSTIDVALKRATVEADFTKQMAKTKDTPFIVDDIDFNIGDNIFIPIGSINELRREMIEALTNNLLNKYLEDKRSRKNALGDNKKAIELNNEIYSKDNKDKCIASDKANNKAKYTISVRTMQQIQGVIELFNSHIDIANQTRRVYIDMTDIKLKDVVDALSQLSKFNQVQIFITLPHVIFEDYKNAFMDKLAAIDTDLYQGMLVRTLGQVLIAKAYKKEFVTDYNLHTFNSLALDELRELGACGVTLSMELNKQGLKQIIKSNPLLCETVIYGSTSLMHSANCVYKTRTGKCDKKQEGHQLDLLDRKGINHQVSCHCNMCYNTISNKHPLLIQEETLDFNGTFRLDFTSELLVDTKNIIIKLYNHSLKFDQEIHTRGHFNKGVK